MRAIEFEGQNVVFAKDQPEYTPLPAFINPENNGEVVTKWELTEEEILTIIDTRSIWLSVLTFNKPLQPVFMTTDLNDIYSPENNSES